MLPLLQPENVLFAHRLEEIIILSIYKCNYFLRVGVDTIFYSNMCIMSICITSR